jgi:hypothetical protein
MDLGSRITDGVDSRFLVAAKGIVGSRWSCAAKRIVRSGWFTLGRISRSVPERIVSRRSGRFTRLRHWRWSTFVEVQAGSEWVIGGGKGRRGSICRARWNCSSSLGLLITQALYLKIFVARYQSGISADRFDRASRRSLNPFQSPPYIDYLLPIDFQVGSGLKIFHTRSGISTRSRQAKTTVVKCSWILASRCNRLIEQFMSPRHVASIISMDSMPIDIVERILTVHKGCCRETGENK